MLRDVTLGQFLPGNSILHKLDPRTKLLCVIIFIVAVFLANSIPAYIALIAVSIALILISRIPMKVVLRSFRALLFVIIFTAILNLFFTTGEKPLFAWKFIHIYPEGIEYAVKMIIRVSVLLIGSSVILTYTTSPIDITDGIERLLKPLKYIKIPVHEFAMMMSIALRFIPTLIEETDKIMSAQKARGADFSTGSIGKRIKALVPILIPLFISAFRRADELAVAMECRCYRGDKRRTRMKVLRLKARDYIFFILTIAFAVGLFFMNKIPFPSIF